MIEFDPENPFPLLSSGAPSYRDAQEHSALVDAWLGLATEAIEHELSESRQVDRDVEQAWIGLPIQTLQTPYTELREIVEILKSRGVKSVVDLGAGYGRLGFVISKHGEGMTFTGYELVGARVEEAKRRWSAIGVERCEIFEADLEAPGFTPIEADAYFLYDFGTRRAIDKCLEDLRRIAARRPIVVIGRGRASRDAIERGQPWLSQVVAPEHHAHYSIYRSRP